MGEKSGVVGVRKLVFAVSLEVVFLECECMSEKGGSRIYTKKLRFSLFWGDESLAVFASVGARRSVIILFIQFSTTYFQHSMLHYITVSPFTAPCLDQH